MAYNSYDDQEQQQNRSEPSINSANRIVDGIKNHRNQNTAPAKDITGDNGNFHLQTDSKPSRIPDSKEHDTPYTGKGIHSGNMNSMQNAALANNLGQTAGGASKTVSGSAASSAGSAAGSAAGGASGTAAGAAIGSIAPGIGTAIGAAAAKTADTAKKTKEASKASEQIDIKAKSKGMAEAKETTVADTNVVLRIVVGIVAVFAGIIFTIVILGSMLIQSVAAPIMAVFKLAESGINSISSFFSGEPTFEEIQSTFISDLEDAFSTAYTDTCQDEVYQIAIEQGYDIELTMESYNNTKFPYNLSGEDCNINYAEIFNIISLADKWDFDDWKNFDYENFLTLYDDKEFLRTLYTLQVEQAEKYVINESALAEGETCEIHPDMSVTVSHTDGSTSTYEGEDAESYYEIIIYGEVSVSAYGLLEIFDYFHLDPYAASKILPNMTNWKAMEYQEYFTRCYEPDVFWGTEERSKLIPYNRLTGELVEDAGGMYLKDIHDALIIAEDYVYYDVVEYKQADPRWGLSKYLGHTMASYGCCVTSMAMVINFFGNSSIDPGSLLAEMNKNYQGNLYRARLSESYGFGHYLDDNSFNLHFDLTKITGELVNERLVMAHIKPNSSTNFSTKNGHWIVIHGFQRDAGSSGFFYVNDPNRNNETMSFAEAVFLIDRIQSYGHKR